MRLQSLEFPHKLEVAYESEVTQTIRHKTIVLASDFSGMIRQG